MPDDAVTHAPDSVRELKLLDPACGSGHFLVIAFELLFFSTRRRRATAAKPAPSHGAIARSSSRSSSATCTASTDPRAVQIAAAALMLKARQLCPDAEPRTLNLVAPNLSLASLADDDPALRALYAAVEHETGIPPALTGRIVHALAGADHLGTLLKVDAEIHDSLAHSAAAPILAAWEQHGPAIDSQRTLKAYLQERFFPDVHRKMYENRPIYFPLSSENKSFVAYVSIHRWTASTLNDLLAEHLYPAKWRLEGEQTDLRPARDGADKKAADGEADAGEELSA